MEPARYHPRIWQGLAPPVRADRDPPLSKSAGGSCHRPGDSRPGARAGGAAAPRRVGARRGQEAGFRKETLSRNPHLLPPLRVKVRDPKRVHKVTRGWGSSPRCGAHSPCPRTLLGAPDHWEQTLVGQSIPRPRSAEPSRPGRRRRSPSPSPAPRVCTQAGQACRSAAVAALQGAVRT
nr:unnamed protein product [Rangifer tarandus platyrhynchus]